MMGCMTANDTSWTSDPLAAPAVTLGRVWRVNADAAYDIHWPRGLSGDLIALRTLAGRGRMTVDGQAGFALTGGTLAILSASRVRHYACTARRWQFWWLEFTGGRELSLPLHRAMDVAVARGEAARMQQCFDLLRRQAPAASTLASAICGVLLAGWRFAWRGPGVEEGDPQARAVARAIDAMRENLARPLSAGELSAVAGLGPRRFREVFRQVTGASPKRYYDSLRLSLAAELLRMGGQGVAQVAERLGYSSPFHFSRAFKAHHGLPPSSYLRR